MGCDIHIIAEARKNGKWKKNTKLVFKNSWYNPKRWAEQVQGWKDRLDKKEITQEQFDQWSTDDSLGQQKEYISEPSSNRYYDWFAVLANVRNGRGFAGIKTGEGFIPISSPKGIPEDCSPEWLTITKDWGSDMHSHSYLTLAEITNFDWNQVTMKSGIISLKQYKELKDTTNSPETWSGAISGPGIVTVSTTTADQILAGTVNDIIGIGPWDDEDEKPVADCAIYVKYQWPVLYSEWFKDELHNLTEGLKQLANNPEDTRIVFGFDN